jgi:F0F1-type ATP synthase assembly protein I
MLHAVCRKEHSAFKLTPEVVIVAIVGALIGIIVVALLVHFLP